jgi:UDP-N-acetylglucosamine 2-epimerase (non-hydrolysing)
MHYRDKATMLYSASVLPTKKKHRSSVLALFGTRPEVIKLASVIRRLEQNSKLIHTINVASGQHADLATPFIEMFGIRIDFDLHVMTENQSAGQLLRRIVRGVTDIANRERPDLIMVQGDTTTALAGAIAGQRCGVPVAHVEAGLRSGNLRSPYPEEIQRIAISRLASIHFAPTERNRDRLLEEGINEGAVFVTGNTVVDALQMVRRVKQRSASSELLARIGDRKYIVLTTHRRESFGARLRANLQVLRDFVQEHEDVALVFPVHPNPYVRFPAHEILEGYPRINLIEPLSYFDFIHLVLGSWLVVSDSGGVQEEAPSLGKPVLILRENTERPECIEAGMARLVGCCPEKLRSMLEEAYTPSSWVNYVQETTNPFGCGNSGECIANHIVSLMKTEPVRTVTEAESLLQLLSPARTPVGVL